MAVINQVTNMGASSGELRYANGTINRPSYDTASYPYTITGLDFTPQFVSIHWQADNNWDTVRNYSVLKLISPAGDPIWYISPAQSGTSVNVESPSYGTIQIESGGISGIMNNVDAYSSSAPIRWFAIGLL